MNQTSQHLVRNMMTGSIRIFFAEVLIIPVGFITAVFLARQLGPVNFGLFVLALRLVTWVEWTSLSVFYSATVKFVSEEDDWRAVGTTVVRLHLVVGVGIAALLWVLSSPLARAFNEPAMATYLKLFAIDVPIFSLFSVHSSILVGRGLFKERAWTGSIYWIARLALIVLLVEMGLSVNGAIIGVIGASIVGLIISRFFVRPPVLSGATFPVRRLLGFSAPVFLSSVSLRMLRLDVIAFKVLGATAAQVGFYSAGQSLSIHTSLLSGALAPPLLSTLSRLIRQGDESKAKDIGRTAMRLVIWVLPFAAMTAGAATEIVDLVFGREFVSAGPILALLIFAAVGFIGIAMTRAIILAIGRPGWTLIVTAPFLPVAFIGYLIFVPWMGGVGAAIVTTCATCSAAVASFLAVYRLWGILPPAKTLVKSVFCSVLALAMAVFWPVSGLMVILKLLTIVATIFIAFLLLGDFTAGEVALIRTLVGKREWADEDEIEAQ
ncbi:MAG: oligosaccharide flippase family protein [Deltaproteobacteria bacterium]|nr:oligosaccharide flippase family protein [Deltaproteobacteria bacterium]